jgi:ubiquinone biosynthesis protein COQ9
MVLRASQPLLLQSNNHYWYKKRAAMAALFLCSIIFKYRYQRLDFSQPVDYF